LLSYLRRLYYDLYEIQYSLAGVQRGLVLGFICALESTVSIDNGWGPKVEFITLELRQDILSRTESTGRLLNATERTFKAFQQ
jgi:hypothetical protein